MSEAAAPAGQRGLESKWKVLISVMFGIFMIILDSTIINVAFPTLRSEFGASLGDAQWVLSVYVLALGVTTPVSGFLADRFGIKRIYLLGLGIFTLGSLLCGFAHAPCKVLAVGWRSRSARRSFTGLSRPKSRAQPWVYSVLPWWLHRRWVPSWVAGWWIFNSGGQSFL